MNSKEIIEKQTKYIIPSTTEGRWPVVIVEGKGAIVKDLDGKEYIDCHAGYAAVNVGHCHPRIVKAIQEAAAKIWHVSWDFYTVSTALLAEKIVEITPKKLSKVLFCSVGAEAVENAIKFAKKYQVKKHGRPGAQIVSLMGAFHGRTAYAMSLTGKNKYKDGLSTYVHLGVVHAFPPYCYRCPFKLEYPECDVHCAKYLEDLIYLQTTGDIAAFICEPIFGEGGIIVPPKEYIPEAVKIFREHGALFIDDEVQTGFGRTGKLFGIEWYNVEPDIMTLAKGIASGVPIAAVVTTEEVASVMGPIDHCSTYGGNEVTCAAALENIKVLLEEKLHEKALEIGKIFMEGLNELMEKHKLIGDVRGKGLMIGIELVKDREKKTPAPDEANKVRMEAQKRGLLINVGGMYGNVLRIQPPLLITEEQAKKALEILDNSLEAA